jgi:hypothetical protein
MGNMDLRRTAALLILCILCLFAGYAAGQPHPRNCGENAISSGKPLLAGPLEGRQAPSQAGDASDDCGLHWYTSPEWWLCILAVPSLFLLWGQTYANEQAAKAAKASADAALLNAQAVIKSERPWMLFTEIAGMNLEPIEAQQNRPTMVGLNFRNSGKTVARITAWKFGLFITGVDAVPPPSVFDTSGIPFKPTVIPMEVPLPYLAQLEGGRIIKQEELRDIAERRTRDLWLCGIVRYQDVFDPQNEHVTKICRRYYAWDDQPIFVLDGPAPYNDET